MRRLAPVMLVLLGPPAVSAWAQTPARDVQTGVKTSDAGFAAAIEVQLPVADAEATGKILDESFALLLEATVKAGFTPLGQRRAVLFVDLRARPQGSVAAQLQVPFIEQPTEDDREADRSFDVVCIEPVKVAYTYHKGSLADIGRTLTKLIQWTIGQGLDINGSPQVIAHGLTGDVGVGEVQIPVE